MRPSDSETVYAICVKNLFAERNVDAECRCPQCTVRWKRNVPAQEIEFPLLVENAVKNDLR